MKKIWFLTILLITTTVFTFAQQGIVEVLKENWTGFDSVEVKTLYQIDKENIKKIMIKTFPQSEEMALDPQGNYWTKKTVLQQQKDSVIAIIPQSLSKTLNDKEDLSLETLLPLHKERRILNPWTSFLSVRYVTDYYFIENGVVKMKSVPEKFNFQTFFEISLILILIIALTKLSIIQDATSAGLWPLLLLIILVNVLISFLFLPFFEWTIITVTFFIVPNIFAIISYFLNRFLRKAFAKE